MAGRGLIRAAALLLALPLAACVSRASFDAEGARVDLPPYSVAEGEAPAGEVVWGGMVIEVRNRPEASDLIVLAYPIDRRLRPQLKAPTQGRFIVRMPGFVEPYDFPEGRFVTVRGRVLGTHEGHIEERRYVYPVIAGDRLHLWREGFQNEGPRFSIGIGVVR